MSIDLEVTSLRIGDIDVEIRFKPIKNLHLSVHPPFGKVTVSSPDFFDLDKVRVYLVSKLSWIRKEQRKILGQAREGEKLFITRESHQLFGKRYLLRQIDSPKNRVTQEHNHIDLHAQRSASVAEKKKIMYRWYRKQLFAKIEELIQQYAILMNLDKPHFGIRVMKTKWGSCAIESQKLWFNVELAKKPMECVEYIVVHEMVHLIERNHNKNFIILMDRYMPNWRVQKKILNELPL